MELEEEEAQICRLCGQCESIYIDVFGEEGTKRFLGLKIHTKINILIDERDPLPKAICVQCLGKLEFVCDFQEECLRTQQVLRDRYNLPPLTEIAEVKTEDTAPSTSTNNNNNIDKNLNSPNEENIKDIEHRVLRTATKSQRTSRNQQPVSKLSEDVIKDQSNAEEISEPNLENVQIHSTPESTPTRWLRSRQNAETTCVVSDSENTADPPIANRLRSHGNTSLETTPTARNSTNSPENVEKQIIKQQDPHTIQIPTSALNKLLTIVSNSPNIEVSVKESRNHNNDTEDISFTVELCKKQSDDVATVRARVFPDQGSCLVDKAIVSLLQNQSCVEVNSIINTIINSSVKNGNSTKLKDSAEFEQKWQASQNPEELFRIDGEEIRVDDNVEHVVADNQNGYACKLCRKFYERKDKCMVHVKTHLGIKQYTCILCNAKFVCKSDVMKHIRCSHTNPRPIQCPKCPKRFKSKFYLTEHDNVHKGVRPYCCTDCGQSYHHKVSLQIHMKSHLPPQNLACEYCGKVFPYRTRLLSHIASVHLKNRRNFRCRFCYNLYSSLSVLNEHIKTRHATTYTCEVCSKTFKVASKYKAHVLQHSNPKPFVCNICNNRYASKAFLNEHLLKHEGLRKHICQKCGASFAQASHLAAHRHVHGEKKHACPECGRKFNRRDNMKVHRKRHFEEKKTGNKQKNASSNDVTSIASNEKIKENDGLPQRVCMRCLGTLEFLCDFYERCHLTQKDLLEANRNMTEAEYRKLESDAESDKENALPSANEVKRKIRTISPDSTRSTKSCLTTKNSQYYKADRKDGTNVHHADIKTTNIEVVQPVAQTSVQLSNLISKTKSTTDFIDAHEEKLEDDENHCSTLKFEKVLEEKEDLKETQTTRSGIINKSLNSIPKSTAETYTGVKSEQRVRQKRGRKSKLEKMRQANQLSKYVSVKRGLQKDLEGKKYDDTTDRLKRHCLRTICANKSDTSIVSKSQNERELVSKEQTSIESISTESHTVLNDSSIGSNNNKTSKKFLETQESCKASGKSHDCIKKSEDGLTKSKQVSVIVKQEKPEIEEDASQQGIPFVWIAAEMFTQKPENPKSQKEKVLSHMSPPPGDEAERSKSSESNSMVEDKVLKQSGISNCANYEDLRPVTFMEQNRVTVIKSSQNSDVIASEGVKHCHLEVNHLDDIIDQSTRDSLESDVLERSLSRRSSRDSSFSGNKSKDGKFGKISELISEEQKETIETYYRVDMSIVNSEEVKRNITIVDKKNIKCNICGTLYLRMDKCKVHIWGHLKMKPYQCNACDFATVTVSNVRCHIRKSHLKIKPFACHLCEKRYVTAVLLEEHLNTHTGARPFKCKVCDFASASRQMLSYHNTTHKPIKDVSCKICGKEFYSRGRLRAHMLIHNKDKVVMCKLCSAYLSNAGALETHHKNIHMRDYICNVCGKHVKSRKALHNHQNVHAAAKYKCSLCPNVYKSSQILKEHLLKHEGIRKYKCNVCEKSFAQQSHLAAHMAVHSKIRFHCPGCDKAFNRHDNMKIHTKRCKPFLANPELKNLLTRKGRTKLSGGMTDSVTLSSNTDTSKSPRRVKDQTEETSTKIVNDTKKTDMNLCKLGLNISCIETMDKSWEHNVQGAGDITNSTDIHVLHITKVNDKLIPENENLTIHENILGPESF